MLINLLIGLVWGGGDSGFLLLLRAGLWALLWAVLSWRSRRLWLFPVALLLWAVFVCQALISDTSTSRQAMLYSTKLSQIRRGRLRYLAGWGWVDVRHRLLDVWEQLQTRQSVVINHIFFGYPSLWGRQAYQLRIVGDFPDPLQKLRLIQLLGERCEAEELRLPWWTGAPSSAYNADDLTSVYFTIFERAHPECRFAFDSPLASERRWQEEGQACVLGRVHDWKEFRPTMYGVEFAALMERLETVKVTSQWALEGPFSLKQ